MGGKNNLE